MGNKPKILGGFGNRFGKQYRQGNRVYDSSACAMSLLASPVGNCGGFSYLYLIQTVDIMKEQNIITKNRTEQNRTEQNRTEQNRTE